MATTDINHVVREFTNKDEIGRTASFLADLIIKYDLSAVEIRSLFKKHKERLNIRQFPVLFAYAMQLTTKIAEDNRE